MEPLRLLAVYAHPDDEGAAAAGALALNALHGGESWLVCATRGEVGEISPDSDATPETLGAVREQELRCVATALGINAPIFLDYRDSGMVGTPENEDPRSLHQADKSEVVAKLTTIVRRIRPDVVITFAEDGMYGHPDHVAVHHVTKRAVEVAGDGSYAGSAEPAWQPKRLYYGVIVREWMKQFFESAEATEIDRPARRDDFGTPLADVALILDVSSVAEKKRQAMTCHVSQLTEMMKRFINADTAVLGNEAYSLGWSADGKDPKGLTSFLEDFG